MDYLIKRILTDLEAGLNKKDVQYYLFGSPFAISKAALEKGVIVVRPVSIDVSSLTTGIIDNEEMNLNIILAKCVQDEFIKSAQIESGDAYLTRIMDGRDSNGVLLPQTIRNIVRKNLRTWGINQRSVGITYNTNDLTNVPEGTVMATLNLGQNNHQNQTIL